MLRNLVRLIAPVIFVASVQLVSYQYIYTIYDLNSRLNWRDWYDGILHLVFSVGVTLAFLLIATFLVTTSKTSTRLTYLKRAFSILLAVYLLLLAIFYCLSIMANLMWGDNITLQLVTEYISQVPWLLSIIPLSKSLLSIVVIFCVIGLCIFFILSYRLGQSVFTSIQKICGGWNLNFGHVAILTLLLTSSFSVIVWQLFATAVPNKFWKEPFMDFFYSTNYVAAGINPWRIRMAQLDAQSREAYPQMKLTDPPNVIIIMVDSLRPDHMGVYDYQRPTTPFLSSLDNQHKLQKADLVSSTCPNSYCGILSTLSSKSYRDLSYENFKVYDLLKDLGYQINFIITGSHFSWYNLEDAYGDSIDHLFDFRQTSLRINDDEILVEGLKQLAPYSGLPTFFYFHLMSVHVGGVKHDKYNVYEPYVLEFRQLLQNNQEVRINRYDNSIIQADAYIKQIAEHLDRLGYLNNSLVLITSDHGENLGEEGNLPDHGWSLYQHQIAIPLLIYDSHGVTYQDLSFAAQADFAPTIIDRLGLPVPEVWQGHSLLTVAPEKCSYHQSVKGTPSQAVICRINQTIYKYIVWDSGVEELYKISDSVSDGPNLIDNVPDHLLYDLRKKFAAHWHESISD